MNLETTTRRRAALRWLLPLVGLVGVLGGVAAAGAGPFGGIRESRSEGPKTLTQEQCRAAGSMLRVSAQSFPAFLKDHNQEQSLQAFEAEQQEAELWVAAGCPPDPVRGFYPVDGTGGGQMRLYRSEWFISEPTSGETPSISWRE